MKFKNKCWIYTLFSSYSFCKGYHYAFLFGSSLNSYLIHMAWIALVISYNNLKLMRGYCKSTNDVVTITVICVWISNNDLTYTSNFSIFRMSNSICVLPTALKFGRRTFLLVYIYVTGFEITHLPRTILNI